MKHRHATAFWPLGPGNGPREARPGPNVSGCPAGTWGRSSRAVAGLVGALLWGAIGLLAAGPAWGDGAAAGPSFNRDIRPLLADRCFACHGPDAQARQAELRLDQPGAAIEQGAIVAGDAAASPLVERIESSDPELVMPPPSTNKPLTEEQRKLLRDWISAGAPYEQHWSLRSVPAEVAVPAVDDPAGWIRSPLDALVLTELNRRQLRPAREAERAIWLRRVSFDLTGLPPTLGELDEFLADASPLAYERQVERLLASPAYGERMAGAWLDVARYADTFGYQADRKMHVWPWRDWVIRAFNQNLPYRDFLVWQTAGDLLPEPTQDQRLATAFNRLHRQTNEGGSIEAEFRQAYIADRVVTNGMAWLGLTLDCARCHDHKFDPITQRDFYRLAAFFANIDEHGLYSHFTETAPTPALPLYAAGQEAQHRQLRQQIAEQQTLVAQALEAALARVADQPAPAQEPLAADAQFSFDDLAASGDYGPVPGLSGQAAGFGGDDALTLGEAGAFNRTTPFSFALWVKPGSMRPREIVLHRAVAAEDAAFRGYQLVLDNGRPAFSLIHFWPGNALRVAAREVLPPQRWSHLAVTYDGSSRAEGVTLFIDGHPADHEVLSDGLTRDITYDSARGDSGSPKLSLGARFRDVGFRGGAVDELLVFHRQLAPCEVARLVADQAAAASTLAAAEPTAQDSAAGGSEPAPATAEAEIASANSASSPSVSPNTAATDRELWLAHLRLHDAEYLAARDRLQELREQENALISAVPQIMVMEELAQPRPTHVLRRGAYDAPGEAVSPGTPESLPPLDPSLPPNRLALAHWLVDDANPLVSRVAVNRFWQLFFGRGLVATAGDFGSQGQPPTHPELLDWLARRFMQSGWDVKRLASEIVLSATYRQSSTPADPEFYLRDPDNLWLARGPRHRLDAEQIRDNALAVSGLLSPTLGGPSVFPYQPEGLWEEAGTGQTYTPSEGEGLYRRSLYTFWRRTAPPPTMLAFDAPTREVCVAARERTATPLQALALLNDPQLIEAARVLAARLLAAEPSDGSSPTRTAFRLLTSRPPSQAEQAVLDRLFAEQLAQFEAAPEQAQALLTVGQWPAAEGVDPVRQAALCVAIQALLSHDLCVTKR